MVIWWRGDMAGFVLNYNLVVKVTGLADWKHVDSLEVQLHEKRAHSYQ